ncbi:MAG: hypothetical protein H7282_11045 [Cytophagaceae bacterium]|nr:hypothetical protein [Cytophagaceae bacterium]
MKSNQFKRNPTDLRFVKERPVKKKEWNWDKIIYLTILAVSLFFLVSYGFKKVFYVSAEGQVLFQALDVQLVNDIQIHTLSCTEGDSVQSGDTLFTYVNEKQIQDDGSDTYLRTVNNQIDWKTKEAFKIEEEISLKEIEQKNCSQLLSEVERDKSRIKKEVYLDVYTIDKLNPYLRQSVDLKMRIDRLGKEIELLNQTKARLGQVFESDSNSTIDSAGHQQAAAYVNQMPVQTFLSPVSGVISHVFKKDYETVLESEHILSLHMPKASVYIKVFFEQSDMRYLHAGDIVDVKFANGYQTKGRIKRFYFDTYDLPVHLKNGAEDYQHDIEADVVPLEYNEDSLWRKAQKLEVEITKRRYF